MEKHILEQYTDLQEEERDLNRRIQQVEDQLAKMEEKGYVVSDSVTCGKKGKKPLGTKRITGFPYPEYNKKKQALKRYKLQLQLMDDKLLEMLNDVEEYINSIKDSRIRRIIRYKYVDDMTWPQVACRMGKKHTADSCRMAITNFLKEEK